MSALLRMKSAAAQLSTEVRKLLNAQTVLEATERHGQLPSIDSSELCGQLRAEIAVITAELVVAAASFTLHFGVWLETQPQERQDEAEVLAALPLPYVPHGVLP